MENISEIGFEFIKTLGWELNNGKLELPAFPDVALRIKKVLEDPDVSAEQVALVVGSEPILSARLLKVANSAMLNTAGVQINDIRTAITRLGFNMVHNTAVSIAMEQIIVSETASSTLREALEDLWRGSLRVAALSYVIAKKQTSIKPDEAMLAGLLHDIGKIYIWTRVETKFPELFQEKETLEDIIQQWYTGVGSTILRAWDFSESVSTAVDEQENIDRTHFGSPDLADVVLVANLYANLDKPGQDWTKISAIERLNLSPETVSPILDESMDEVQSVMQALGY